MRPPQRTIRHPDRQPGVAAHGFYGRNVDYFYMVGIFGEIHALVNALFTTKMFLCCIQHPAISASRTPTRPVNLRGGGCGFARVEASMVNTMMLGAAVSHADDDSARETGSVGAPRYSRRLSDKVLIAFHHACDQADFEVAEQLLHILERMLTRRPLTPDGTRRRNMESLVAAHERLWHLRHPNSDEY
jgi:hypothetical protein